MKKIVLIFWAFALLPFASSQAELTKDIVVYKSPDCTCCSKWVRYLESEGYEVEAIDTRDVYAWKKKYGVPEKLAACHTAVIDGYVVEGHATDRDIKRLLLIRPEIKGIAIPGMPIGTPGMESGNRREPYDVMTFDEEGNTEVFVRHR
jgi:hypothetical protein